MFFTLCSAVSKLCFERWVTKKCSEDFSVLCNCFQLKAGKLRQLSWFSLRVGVIFLESALHTLSPVPGGWESNYLLSSAGLRCSFSRCKALLSLLCAWNNKFIFLYKSRILNILEVWICFTDEQAHKGQEPSHQPWLEWEDFCILEWGSNWASLISTVQVRDAPLVSSGLTVFSSEIQGRAKSFMPHAKLLF